MKKVMIIVGLCVIAVTAAYAATAYTMECRAKACGYGGRVALGPTMMSGRITGYCRNCKEFVALSWKTRDMRTGRTGIEPKPLPLGEIWDSQTGKVTPVYACPKCKGPFAEIKRHADIKHCPSCNKPGFGIDKDAPVMAID